MLRVAGARHHEHVLPERADLPDNFVDAFGFADGDDDRRGLHEAATLQKLRIGRVTTIDGAPLPSLLRNGGFATIDGNVLEFVPVQHRADDLSDPAMSDDNGMVAAAARRNGKFGIERLVLAHHGASRRATWESAGMSIMVSDVSATVKPRHLGIDQTERCRHADADEGELAARAEQEAHFDGCAPGKAKRAGRGR